MPLIVSNSNSSSSNNNNNKLYYIKKMISIIKKKLNITNNTFIKYINKNEINAKYDKSTKYYK